jgi:hypothetical protein
MKFNDLHTFPENHPPSPYGDAVHIVRIGNGFLPKGLVLRAVGWIEDQNFPTGHVLEECIDLLVDAHGGKILHDTTKGVHTCTLCNGSTPTEKWKGKPIRLLGYGHYLVQKDNIVYMAPELLLHYILAHEYRLPDEFIQGVLHGKFLGEDDLVIEWE